ncbi:GLIPR1-like protein 1 [Holothuria leucospilota]|uniref:GLIPR1-like protein 1 n=1 Tax=Holothuria leucospilota TaxID=206669 RepID=A0A9Q1CAL6_HOLLE|nr:GLIPR1-like protein 1 [Holothuria leucospilota]
MAQDWSDGCVFEHGNPTNISPFSSVGQNLWLGTGSESAPPDGTGPTQSWYNEVQYYTFDTTECSSVCGHYTQVVWASSYAVGCGRTFCSTVTWDDGANVWNNAWLVTCNYGPAGNYAGAQPYTEGSSCSQCDSGVGQCYNNLCRKYTI